MIKTNLPVILIKNRVLLPHNETRIDVGDAENIAAIMTSMKYSNNHVLIISSMQGLDKSFDSNNLPKMGVIAKIKTKIDLGNAKTRIIVEGINRARVFEYTNVEKQLDFVEAKIGPFEKRIIPANEQQILIKKVTDSLRMYINMNPMMSNSIIARINDLTKASQISDIIAYNLPFDEKRLYRYLLTTNPLKRMRMLLDDLAKEEAIISIEKDIDMKVKYELDKSQKDFILREKIKVIKNELGETSSRDTEVANIKKEMKKKKLPKHISKRLNEEIKRYELLPALSPETGIVRSYIDWILDLPWNNYSKDNLDLKNVKDSLDESHFALKEAKERVIEYLAVKSVSDNLRSPILCLVGPPGVGKTSLVKSIAESIDRKFVKISVGGVKDESEISGHRRTYIGANPGRIIQAMKKAGTSNPLFLIDEIDKMTADIKGDPASALLEVLDFEQNSKFSDNYIEEEFDLSSVMFIATANYLNQIPEALYDRLEIIPITGYTEYEKIDIAKRHLIPRQLKEHGLNEKDIIFKDDILKILVNSYTKEAGVRDLDRVLAKITRKVITEKVLAKKVVRKKTITEALVEKYLGKAKYKENKTEKIDQIGKVNGLAYTSYGGAVLPIEVTYYKGNGDLKLTGSLGDVMKESANIALSYIKAKAKEFKIDEDILHNSDIHIHVPEGATPKDGPSAGIALTTALISALTKKKARSDIAMTGEITLRGYVLPIGGLKEKSMGAYRSQIKTIIIPEENEKDIDDLPEEIKSKIKFITVSNYDEVYKKMFSKR